MKNKSSLNDWMLAVLAQSGNKINYLTLINGWLLRTSKVSFDVTWRIAN